MEISVAIRLDNNGLLRKECPFCEREFKIFYDQLAEETRDKFYCPHCGLPAPFNTQYTKDQVQFIMDLTKNHVIDELNKSFGKMKKRSSNSTLKINYKPMKKTDPRTQIELNDMEEIITSCCKETIFLESPATWKAIYCHKCGDINFPEKL
ncbi:hypothetical protein [Bacillus sp. FJAT-52991]|uniref:CpXC domain-containing protein n=1 Tax=Bacillus kandeliae TaxID=3129297 RepID=A0ABZ2N2X2_9BACI